MIRTHILDCAVANEHGDVVIFTARDIEYTVTRAITNHAKAEGAKRLVGDIRDIANGKRLNRNAQQKVSGWSHGRQIAFLVYKLAAEGIALERQSEAYRSKTCPVCGRHNKPKGRNYRCARCGFVGHRDAVGAINQESQAVHGAFGHVQVGSVTYRRAFVRRSSPDTGHVAREAHPADGSREAAGL